MRTPHWPLFDLVVRTPRLELRPPDDELALALGELATKGIHDPATMPFGVPWTDAPDEEMVRNSLQHFWANRASWKPTDWQCPMAIVVDGEIAGVQAIFAKDFPTLRAFESGSWLGQTFQGRGIGKEMRAAILHLGFAGLGGHIAITGAWPDNERSLGVTRALGYEPNGANPMVRRDKADRMLRFTMTREQWEMRRRDDITIEGLEPCLAMFGA
jgi:RimJ/RimL family protein N-acetyltransferase